MVWQRRVLPYEKAQMIALVQNKVQLQLWQRKGKVNIGKAKTEKHLQTHFCQSKVGSGGQQRSVEREKSRDGCIVENCRAGEKQGEVDSKEVCRGRKVGTGGKQRSVKSGRGHQWAVIRSLAHPHNYTIYSSPSSTLNSFILHTSYDVLKCGYVKLIPHIIACILRYNQTILCQLHCTKL